MTSVGIRRSPPNSFYIYVTTHDVDVIWFYYRLGCTWPIRLGKEQVKMKVTKDIVYAVRSRVTGKFASSYSYHPGYVDDIKQAKFYKNAGQAKGFLTKWKNNCESEKKYARNADRVKQWQECIDEADVVKVEVFYNVTEIM
jgi:hypothetical protein